MKNRFIYLLSVLASLCIAVEASASHDIVERNYITGSITCDQLKDCLVQGRAWVPYPAYADRDGWDRLMGDRKAAIISLGEEYLDYEWKVLKMTDYLELDISGNRTIMQDPYGANNRAIAALLAAELAEGRGRFIPQLINGAIHSCEMTSWALSAHIKSIEKRCVPCKGDTTLELTQGDLSQCLSWVYYFLHEEFDRIHPEFSRRIREELTARELDPFLERTDIWWMGYNALTVLNNWTPWCSANALICFMLMEDDPDRLAQAVWKSMKIVDAYLNRIQGDGGIEEGPSYWWHSSGMVYEYLTALKAVTGGRIDAFGVDQIRGMGEYIVKSYVGGGWVVNFADASAQRDGRDFNLIYRFGNALGSSLMEGYAVTFRDTAPVVPRPGLFFSSYLEALACADEFARAGSSYEPSAYTWYPETQFHYMSSGDVFLAAKGGNNNESHNHNDVGTFSLYVGGTPVLIDVGVGVYTYKTFSPRRYEIWNMQSGWHNIPVINGVEQRNGDDFKAADVKSSPGAFSADIAGAYPQEAAVKRWVRSYVQKGNSVTVGDRFELNELKEAARINFLLWHEPELASPGLVSVVSDGRRVSLKYDAAAFEATKEKVVLDDQRLRQVWGPEIWRLTLTASKPALRGNYKYVISAE